MMTNVQRVSRIILARPMPVASLADSIKTVKGVIPTERGDGADSTYLGILSSDRPYTVHRLLIVLVVSLKVRLTHY